MGKPGQETEVKLYVNDLERVRKRLQTLDAHLVQPRTFEVNLRFDLPDESLRREGKILRLRQDQEARLTYKGPSDTSQGVLRRMEQEVSVSDFETARNILHALGYTVSATYEKYRTTFEIAGLFIMLDELPYGDFVEIEGTDTADIQDACLNLGLDFRAAIPASYLALFERLCAEKNLDPTQLTFSSLTELQPTPELLKVQPAD